MEKEKLTRYLEKLGLTDLEAQIYVTLLGSGPLGVRELADLVGIKRTTTYRQIDNLIAKSLLIKIIRGSRKQVAIAPPEKSLKHLMEEKLDTATSLQVDFPDILKTINEEAVLLDESNNAEIQYYKGKAGVKKIYEDALKSSELRIYANLLEAEKILLPKELSMFEKALKNNPKLKIYEIVADDPKSVEKFNLGATSKRGGYFYKFMPVSVGLVAACILIYDNRVAIINVKEKSSSLVIHNTDYYINSKKIFDFNWQMLP
jgi:sugar-specific transcriptional regulator TrmB